jgi:hypothetical protein
MWNGGHRIVHPIVGSGHHDWSLLIVVFVHGGCCSHLHLICNEDMTRSSYITSHKTQQDKLILSTTPWRRIAECNSLTWYYMEASGQLHTPAALTPEKVPPVPTG